MEDTYTRISNEVILSKELTVYDKTVYMVLCQYCYGYKDRCFPSLDNVAEIVGCSKRKVIESIRKLEQQGFLHVKRRGFGMTNVYTIL